MYYLSEFTEYNDSKENKLFKGLKQLPNKFLSIPYVNQQLKDFGKENVQRIVSSKKLNLRQKIKVGKKYLKYRKHLGDTYGKEKGMEILNKQKNYISNIFKPSYEQVPLEYKTSNTFANFKKEWDINTNNPLDNENNTGIGSKILKGAKWAAGATASGKILDLGRRVISYRIAKNNLTNPKIKLNSKQKLNYQKILENKGAKGELVRNFETIKGIGNIGNIGEKTKNLLKSRRGKFLVGGLGTLGVLGGLGYQKAKEYYYL